ncbi:hypothetical protein LCGC14_1463970 [marine sediment metagenome]|uniref:Uncharacterized protein n=1 Tax=marine sediment metagenome TaxID=412755 RepID=A0A0F9MG39_9ZZZZ
MNIDLDLLKSACKMVCGKTTSPDLFNEMQSEVYLSVYGGKYENTKQGIVSCAWKFYRDSAKHFHVSFDDIAIYSDIGSRSGSKYNQKLVEPVYLLRAKRIRYKDIGEELNISTSWACYNIRNTLHLPIVSTKLKNQALEVTKYFIQLSYSKLARVNFKDGCGNINAKLDTQKVVQMRNRHIEGESISRLAIEFGVSSTVANYAIRGKTWKCV